MSKRTKIIAETIPRLRYQSTYPRYHYRIWDNGDVEQYYRSIWSLVNRLDNTDLWKENIRKLIPGKEYTLVSWHPDSPFEHCFREAIRGDEHCFREVASDDRSRIILEVHGFDPVKCTECGSENTKDSRCLDCGEWL